LVDFFLRAHLIYKAGLEAAGYHGQMNATISGEPRNLLPTFHLSQ